VSSYRHRYTESEWAVISLLKEKPRRLLHGVIVTILGSTADNGESIRRALKRLEDDYVIAIDDQRCYYVAIAI
jgi:hypothetical protein